MPRTESEQAEPNALTVEPKPKTSSGVRRKDYSLERKLEIVRETMVPGASVASVARKHGINANLVFTWRRIFLRGELGHKFIPVDVVNEDPPALPAPQNDRSPDGRIEIETAAGIKVRVSGQVNERMLGFVLAEVRRRS